MALLSFEKELERSRELVPFSNGYEYDCWSSIWCQECIHEKTCPLLLVILHERTPASWQDREPTALNRYTCEEFSNTNETPTEEMRCISSTESSQVPTVSPVDSPSLKAGPRTPTSLSAEDITLRASTPR